MAVGPCTVRLRRGGLALCDADSLITPTLQAIIDTHVPHTAIQAKQRRDGAQHMTIIGDRPERSLCSSSAPGIRIVEPEFDLHATVGVANTQGQHMGVPTSPSASTKSGGQCCR
jgi:hypothetical protein